MLRESIYKNYIPAISPEEELQCSMDKNYFFVFYMDRLLVRLEENKTSLPLMNSLEELSINTLNASKKHYLGRLKGSHSYCLEVFSEEIGTENFLFTGLRSLYGALEEDIFLLAGKAFQIINWDKTHKFCGKCGTKTYEMEDERAKKCPNCGFISFPVISPAVITGIIKDNKILLAHNHSFRGNMHSLIAGFVEAGETLEECVKREIFEEVGLSVKNIKYFGSQSWPFPNSIMVGFIADYESGEIKEDGVEILHADFYDKDNLPELPGEVSIARKIINWYVDNYKG